MSVVSDASPLIGLSAIHSLDLLHKLYGTIHIPGAVYREVRRGALRPGAKEIAAASWIKRHTVKNKNIMLPPILAAGLGEGESEAIALAVELGATLIILDDRDARNYAKAQGLFVTGTAGILVAAKANGLIAEVKPRLDALIGAGIYIDFAIYQATLRLAGE